MRNVIDATALFFQGQNYYQWGTIPWNKALKAVRRLQARIAKAWKEGRHRLVKILQRLLQKSFYAKALAVKRVTKNSGSKTPGIDNVVWKTPATKMKAAI